MRYKPGSGTSIVGRFLFQVQHKILKLIQETKHDQTKLDEPGFFELLKLISYKPGSGLGSKTSLVGEFLCLVWHEI